MIKFELSFWYPKDLLFLTQAEIVTDQQYCSRTAQQALYTIAAQLHDNGDSEVWNAEWDVASLMRSGAHYENFKTHWEIRAKARVSSKIVPQEDSSVPKKQVTLKEVPVNPPKNWVTCCEAVLQELARDSRFLQLLIPLETYNCKRAKEVEGGDHKSYLSRNLCMWFASCIQLDVSIVLMKNKMFSEIFEELDCTYTTLGAHLTEYVRVLFKCFKLRLEPNTDNITKFLKTATNQIEHFQEISKNLQRRFPNMPNTEWLLPFMLTYSIMLSPYDNIAQMWQSELVKKKRTLTMEDARRLLCLILLC